MFLIFFVFGGQGCRMWVGKYLCRFCQGTFLDTVFHGEGDAEPRLEGMDVAILFVPGSASWSGLVPSRAPPVTVRRPRCGTHFQDAWKGEAAHRLLP